MFLGVSSKIKREYRSALWICLYAYPPLVRVHNFPHDRKPKAGAGGLYPFATPEPLEDQFAIVWRNTRSFVHHTDASVWPHEHCHFGMAR